MAPEIVEQPPQEADEAMEFAEEAADQNPVADEPMVDEAVVNEPAAEQEAVVDEPMAEEAVADGPAAEEEPALPREQSSEAKRVEGELPFASQIVEPEEPQPVKTSSLGFCDGDFTAPRDEQQPAEDDFMDAPEPLPEVETPPATPAAIETPSKTETESARKETESWSGLNPEQMPA